MIFPFKVKFSKNLNVKANSSQNEILTFIKDKVSFQNFELKNLTIKDNSFSFKVNFWSAGKGAILTALKKENHTIS